MQTPETRLLQPGEGGSELVQHRGDAQPVNAQKKSDADDEEMADDDDVLCATCCVDQGDTAEEAGCKCCSFNCCCIALILLFFIGGFVGYLYLIAHPRGTNALGSCMNILLENYPACSVDECNTPTALVFGCSTCIRDSECAGARHCELVAVKSSRAQYGYCRGEQCCE